MQFKDGIESTIDRAGMALSICCGVHCVLTPMLVGIAAALPFGWLFDDSTEAILLAVAALTAVVSLVPSYWRRHRRKRCLALFAAGVSLLALAKLGPVGESLEPWTVASGAVLLATAHLVNLYLCKQCRQCDADGLA